MSESEETPPSAWPRLTPCERPKLERWFAVEGASLLPPHTIVLMQTPSQRLLPSHVVEVLHYLRALKSFLPRARRNALLV